MLSVKDYVAQVLSDIREATKKEKSFSNMRGTIDFDIATVANESGGAGLKVGVVGIGGEIGGKLENQVTSRVKFSVQTKGAAIPIGK